MANEAEKMDFETAAKIMKSAYDRIKGLDPAAEMVIANKLEQMYQENYKDELLEGLRVLRHIAMETENDDVADLVHVRMGWIREALRPLAVRN